MMPCAPVRLFCAVIRGARIGMDLPTLDFSIPALPRNVPWERLEGVERVKDFLQPLKGEAMSEYAREFLALDVASEQLRSALAHKLDCSVDGFGGWLYETAPPDARNHLAM